jgi:hypothetical protein
MDLLGPLVGDRLARFSTEEQCLQAEQRQQAKPRGGFRADHEERDIFSLSGDQGCSGNVNDESTRPSRVSSEVNGFRRKKETKVQLAPETGH